MVLQPWRPHRSLKVPNGLFRFNRWLDSKFEDTPRPALLAYPEGHRMQGVFKVDKSKIKTGMLRYAYRRQMPTQIFMSFGNE